MGGVDFPIHFHYPELFLLAIPLFLAWRRWGRVPGVTGWLRLVILAVILVALTGPELDLGGRGIDVVIVADRSRSMPADAEDRISELIRNLQRSRATGDRVGLVTFGGQAQIEQYLSSEAQFAGYQREILPDGSDLNDAIGAALNLVDRRRPARILALTDGEANGPDPRSAARRARESGVPIDYRLFERQRVGDVAVESLLLPEEVAPREPFQFSVRVYSDREERGTVRVLREGRPIATAERDLHPGINQLLFRDLIEEGGFNRYTVEVDVPDDPLPENNRGAGVVRVDAGPRVLVLTADGQEGNLADALRAGRIPVDVARAAEHPLTQDALDPYRAVIVENVPAADLGRQKMERLAQYVEDLGGGLMLTGGERSFGTGGYFKSPLDEVLPVSMELREEHRKSRVAMAIVLDRSGSMMAPVRGGKLKMDLANLGTAECVRLLSAQDMVSVIAVDSAPHVIQAMTPVDDPEGIASKALKIQSEGGGIFVYEGLVAGGKELMQAEGYATRHIILFSDAQDSEEPGDYKNLLKQFEAAGITVSVIGLGKETDVDGALLKDIAALGRGNIMFTEDAEELPRLFTQDTMAIARNTFIRKDDEHPDGFPGRLLADARLMGELGAGAFPNVDGYNLSYIKPEATSAVISQDEYAAPWSAFWYRGLGRVAAVTFEVDGKYTGGFGRWDGYEDFLITHARWLLGGGAAGRRLRRAEPRRTGRRRDRRARPRAPAVRAHAAADAARRPPRRRPRGGPDPRLRLDRPGHAGSPLPHGPHGDLPHAGEVRPARGRPRPRGDAPLLAGVRPARRAAERQADPRRDGRADRRPRADRRARSPEEPAAHLDDPPAAAVAARRDGPAADPRNRRPAAVAVGARRRRPDPDDPRRDSGPGSPPRLAAAVEAPPSAAPAEASDRRPSRTEARAGSRARRDGGRLRAGEAAGQAAGAVECRATRFRVS